MNSNDVTVAGQIAVITEYQKAGISRSEAEATRARIDKSTITRQNYELDSVQAKLTKLGDRVRSQEILLAHQADEIREKDEALKQRDELILEWMVSNEIWRGLAKQYKLQLGLSDEQLVDDQKKIAEIIAKENPKFEKTEFLAKVRNK